MAKKKKSRKRRGKLTGIAKQKFLARMRAGKKKANK